MILIASDAVIEKLIYKHNVDFIEVEEVFYNHGNGPLILDDREQNKTKPPTVWFIGSTTEGRDLKVVLIPYPEEKYAILRTAYEPDKTEVLIYEENTRRTKKNRR